MKTLYLLRHAAAFASSPLNDHARTLSPAGEAEARAVGAFLKEQVLPEAVLCSSSDRTRRTAEIVLGETGLAGLQVQGDRALYLATPEMIAEQVAAADDALSALLVVGHNPGIFDFAHGLSNGAMADFTQDFPTGATAVFRADVNIWADFAPGVARLEQVFIPPPAPSR